jgi:hypothetical protein
MIATAITAAASEFGASVRSTLAIHIAADHAKKRRKRSAPVESEYRDVE